MATHDFDLFVIGAGSGGVRAARMSAAYGAHVGIAEDRYYGGTCVNVGCVPKKLFVYAAHFAEDFADAANYGWTVGETAFDWPTLRDNKTTEIERLNGIYETLLDNAGVERIWGRARVEDPHTVVVGVEGGNEPRFTAERILIATGGWPVVPDFPGKQHVITSNELFFLESLPERLVIVGGGYIAVEFAGIFNGLGVAVTQLYRGPLFLRGFDDDVRGHLAEEMRKKGVDLRFDADVARIDKRKGGLRVTLQDGGKIDADAVLYATGRNPNTAGLELEACGVELGARGVVVVDDRFQSSVASIYALGDVIHTQELTPVAIAEAMVLAANLYAGADRAMDYADVPTAVFSQPPIGTVGLSESQARARYGDVAVYLSRFKPLKHTITGRDEQTLMKLIVDAASDRVVGCHMVGPDAGEITQGLAVALKCGATKAQFDATVGIHPTAAEEFVTMRTPVRAPERPPERQAAE